MTLDEAIKHCLEVAEKNDGEAEVYGLLAKNHNNPYEKLTASKFYADCAECSTEHRQLAEWLQELKAYRKLEICGNCRHYVRGTTHFGECHVTSDIEPRVVSINQACETFDYKDFGNEVEKPQP